MMMEGMIYEVGGYKERFMVYNVLYALAPHTHYWWAESLRALCWWVYSWWVRSMVIDEDAFIT